MAMPNYRLVCALVVIIALPSQAVSRSLVHAGRDLIDEYGASRDQLLPPAAPSPPPLTAAQVRAAADKAFPNLVRKMGYGGLFRKLEDNPSLRGSLLGRLAEEDWIRRNEPYGWKPVKSRIAPENDAWRRRPDGRLEGAQIKTHKNQKKYVPSMLRDSKAEHVPVPDDQLDLVYDDFEKRRLGAIRGGRTEKATEYARQQQRLRKLGRTYAELHEAIERQTRYYRYSRMAGRTLVVIDLAFTGVQTYRDVQRFNRGEIRAADLAIKASLRGTNVVIACTLLASPEPVVTKVLGVALIVVVAVDVAHDRLITSRALTARHLLESIDREEREQAVLHQLLQQVRQPSTQGDNNSDL